MANINYSDLVGGKGAGYMRVVLGSTLTVANPTVGIHRLRFRVISLSVARLRFRVINSYTMV